MKILVKGQVFPKVWNIARAVKMLREERDTVNLGSGTVGRTVYEVELPEGTRSEGPYLTTPTGVRLYLSTPDQYNVGYILSELDTDPLVEKHFPAE